MYDVFVVNYNSNNLTNTCIKSVLSKKDNNLRYLYVLDNSDKHKLELDVIDSKIQIIDNYNGKIFNRNDVIAEYGRTNVEPEYGTLHHAFSIDWFMSKMRDIHNLVLIDSDAILKKKIDFINENLCTIAKLQDSRTYWKDIGTLRFEPTLQYINLDMMRALKIRYFDPNRIYGGYFNERLYDTGGSFLEDVMKINAPFGIIEYNLYINHLGSGTWNKSQFTKIDDFILNNKQYCMI